MISIKITKKSAIKLIILFLLVFLAIFASVAFVGTDDFLGIAMIITIIFISFLIISKRRESVLILEYQNGNKLAKDLIMEDIRKGKNGRILFIGILIGFWICYGVAYLFFGVW